MPLARNISIGNAAFVADVDLSAACAQFKLVRASSTYGNVGLATGASNPAPIGVLQSTGSAGDNVAVALLGPALAGACTNGSALREGRPVTVGSHGFFEPATDSGCPYFATWLGPRVSTGFAVGEVLLIGRTACTVSGS